MYAVYFEHESDGHRNTGVEWFIDLQDAFDFVDGFCKRKNAKYKIMLFNYCREIARKGDTGI